MICTKIAICLLLLDMSWVLGQDDIDVDYCNLNGCGVKHVACHYYGSPGPDCPDNVRFVSLIAHKQYILDVYNKLRNDIAGGLEPFKPAERMATMQWNGDLADLAMLRAMRCTHTQDRCFSTRKFIYPGQTAIWFGYDGDEDSKSIDYIIQKSFQSVVDHKDKFSTAFVDSFPKSSRNPLMGQFAHAIRDKNAYIGCAASFSTYEDSHRVLIVCNYAYANFVDLPVYKKGRPSSQCKTGKNPMYPNLCSPRELYDFGIQE